MEQSQASPACDASEHEHPQWPTYIVSNCTKGDKAWAGGGGVCWQLLLAVKAYRQEYLFDGTKTMFSLL